MWFIALDFRFWFWQILMALEDIKTLRIINKLGLYEWNIMPFKLNGMQLIFFHG
jgi:Flp pilus assembly protein protease CpaA